MNTFKPILYKHFGEARQVCSITPSRTVVMVIEPIQYAWIKHRIIKFSDVRRNVVRVQVVQLVMGRPRSVANVDYVT